MACSRPRRPRSPRRPSTPRGSQRPAPRRFPPPARLPTRVPASLFAVIERMSLSGGFGGRGRRRGAARCGGAGGGGGRAAQDRLLAAEPAGGPGAPRPAPPSRALRARTRAAGARRWRHWDRARAVVRTTRAGPRGSRSAEARALTRSGGQERDGRRELGRSGEAGAAAGGGGVAAGLGRLAGVGVGIGKSVEALFSSGREGASPRLASRSQRIFVRRGGAQAHAARPVRADARRSGRRVALGRCAIEAARGDTDAGAATAQPPSRCLRGRPRAAAPHLGPPAGV
jgi:translation initiation factor IF-2